MQQETRELCTTKNLRKTELTCSSLRKRTLLEGNQQICLKIRYKKGNLFRRVMIVEIQLYIRACFTYSITSVVIIRRWCHRVVFKVPLRKKNSFVSSLLGAQILLCNMISLMVQK